VPPPSIQPQAVRAPPAQASVTPESGASKNTNGAAGGRGSSATSSVAVRAALPRFTARTSTLANSPVSAGVPAGSAAASNSQRTSPLWRRQCATGRQRCS